MRADVRMRGGGFFYQDLFEQKIMKSHLKKFFPDYTGREQNPDAAMAFLKTKFLALNKNSDKKIYTHYTCATDTSSIEKVFNTVRCVLVRAHPRVAPVLPACARASHCQSATRISHMYQSSLPWMWIQPLVGMQSCRLIILRTRALS